MDTELFPRTGNRSYTHPFSLAPIRPSHAISTTPRCETPPSTPHISVPSKSGGHTNCLYPYVQFRGFPRRQGKCEKLGPTRDGRPIELEIGLVEVSRAAGSEANTDRWCATSGFLTACTPHILASHSTKDDWRAYAARRLSEVRKLDQIKQC